MKITLHIGLPECGAGRLQQVLADKREQLEGKGILFPRAAGGTNHTRLFMAVSDPDHVDPLRFNRGFVDPVAQAGLRETLRADLARDVERSAPHMMILSAPQLGGALHRDSELARLRDLLAEFSDDIRVVAHVDEPARLLARAYAAQVMEGRALPLSAEIALADAPEWWDGALSHVPATDPQAGIFTETQAPPFWLDYTALVARWEMAFGTGCVALRAFDADLFAGPDVIDEIRAAFGIEDQIGRADAAAPADQPSVAWLARARAMNEVFLQILRPRKRVLPRMLWRGFLQEIAVGGTPLDPGSLSAISRRFAAQNAALAQAHGLPETLFTPPDPAPDWAEADPTLGFRPTQYLLGFMWRIDRATQDHVKEQETEADAPQSKPSKDNAAAGHPILPPLAVQKLQTLARSPFAPHNRIGAVNEEELAAAYAPAPPRALPPGSAGNVIVACMKNEAPYILEWIAHHRAIGIDQFLIYTNDCSDGTDAILARLDALGIVHHRNNDAWKGKSPQQHALNHAMKESVVRQADWIVHIDVDEFINVRCGNGTLDDFFARVPGATNVAMTWRLFGHNGVTDLADDLVIDQFDTCAPKYCPKPHTSWGFKTMFRNIGAYSKLSCHRPNKLDPSLADKVRWVNGSGQDMTREAAEKGWRNSKKSIGYDLLQLNHYALRSAESFLVKRQRGRALHVDRSIGLNYWIRMDWSVHRDITIKRNIPRLRAEMERLLADADLARLHAAGFHWHKAKAAELHGIPEFRELYDAALRIRLTETERVAYALALDLET